MQNEIGHARQRAVATLAQKPFDPLAEVCKVAKTTSNLRRRAESLRLALCQSDNEQLATVGDNMAESIRTLATVADDSACVAVLAVAERMAGVESSDIRRNLLRQLTNAIR